MGRDTSNAGRRILNSRRTLSGKGESLENTIGRALQDGAQCFVIEEQANYRFLAQCTLPGDGRYIVVPQGDKFGRWVRENGLAGLALLEGGKPGPDGIFREFTYQKLVQFEMTPEALVYVGTVVRLAHLSATVAAGSGVPCISIVLLQGEARSVALGSGSASGAAILHPGESIVLEAPNGVAVSANLQVVLA